MNYLKGITWIFLLLLKLLAGHTIQMGLFKSNSNFNNILPFHTDAIISSLSETSRLRCAEVCLSESLCEGFLFNSNTTECKLSRCSIHGLQISTDHAGWRYFGISNECPEGWSLYNGHCYMYNETNLKWNDARIFCEALGAYLVEINDEMESNWITEKFLKADNCDLVRDCSTWSGGNDITTERLFIWHQSNSPVTFTNWETNQPSGVAGEDCINLRPFGGWNDVFCAKAFKFICEK